MSKDFDKSVKRLEALVTKYTNNITRIMTEALKNPNKSAKYWRDVNRQITLEYNKLSTVYRSWAKINIPASYRTSVKTIMVELNKQKSIAKKMKRVYSELVLSGASEVGVKSLYVNAIADWEASLIAGRNNLLKLTRKTKQGLIAESLIDQSVFEAIARGNLMQNTDKRIIGSLARTLNELAEVIDGEKYVIAGKRRYRPSYYAEMVTRVKFHEAQAFGALQVAKNYGTSLLQVSSHNTTTKICIPFENKIFSVNGKDKRFPPLYETSPFHVNCLHNMFPVFVEAMEVDDSLKGWEDFSKGTADKPPINSSFIPANLRKGI